MLLPNARDMAAAKSDQLDVLLPKDRDMAVLSRRDGLLPKARDMAAVRSSQ